MYFYPILEGLLEKVLIKGCWLPRPHVPWRARYSRPSVTTHGLPWSRLDQARHELFVPILSFPWLNTNIQIWQILLVWFLTTVFNWAQHFLVVESARCYHPPPLSWTWALDPILSKKVAVNTASSPIFILMKNALSRGIFCPTPIKPTALCCQPESQWRVRQTWSAFCSRLLAWLIGWFVKIFKTF